MLGGGSGAALRKAGAAEREAVRSRCGAGNGRSRRDRPSKATLERVRNSLHAAAGDDDVRAAIEAGRLTGDHEPVGLGPFGAAAPAPRAELPRRGQAGRRQAQARDRGAGGRREAARRADAARRELDKRSDAAARAQERLVAAQADLDQAEAESASAAAELERAERAS